jgi:hypothetical protein
LYSSKPQPFFLSKFVADKSWSRVWASRIYAAAGAGVGAGTAAGAGAATGSSFLTSGVGAAAAGSSFLISGTAGMTDNISYCIYNILVIRIFLASPVFLLQNIQRIDPTKGGLAAYQEPRS